MWQNCINNLSPVEDGFATRLPEWIEQAFNRRGVFNKDEMFVPIRSVSFLGKCSTTAYVECPNIPSHHIENAQDFGDDPADYLDEIGQYYWFDFDILGSDGKLIQLRMVVNVGDADCNDGMWGEVWERNTKELVANIWSTGGCQTTIEPVSEKYIHLYKDKLMCI